MNRQKLYRALAPVARKLHAFTTRLLKASHPQWDNRRWSNVELRRWAPLFKGSVINVSGWEDRDKEGGRYEEYFTARTSYHVSNIGGSRGSTGAANEVFLDLVKPLPEQLRGQYDVVFNHTVLEHIYDIHAAVRNLCTLSRDLVVVVVPFSQQVHFDEGSYLDFWRPTPFALASMFEQNGFEMIYCTANEQPVYAIYTFCVATKNPDQWRDAFPPSKAQSVKASRARVAEHLR